MREMYIIASVWNGFRISTQRFSTNDKISCSRTKKPLRLYGVVKRCLSQIAHQKYITISSRQFKHVFALQDVLNKAGTSVVILVAIVSEPCSVYSGEVIETVLAVMTLLIAFLLV